MALLLEHMVGQQLTPWHFARFELPGPLGGGGMRMLAQAADAAYVSTHIVVRGRVNKQTLNLRHTSMS